MSLYILVTKEDRNLMEKKNVVNMYCGKYKKAELKLHRVSEVP